MQRAIALREAGRYKEAIALLRGNPAPNLALLAQLLALDEQDEEAWTVLRAAQIAPPQSARRAERSTLPHPARRAPGVGREGPGSAPGCLSEAQWPLCIDRPREGRWRAA